MMYQEDYLMRLVSNLIKFLLKIIFGKDTASYELSEDENFKESNELHKRLLDLLSKGQINEAENLLFDKFDPKDNRQRMVALDFYQRLNNLNDEFLQENDFSRKEIEEGLKDIAEKAGIATY